MKKEEITTLSELALYLKINKSKLNYYKEVGLLIPIKEVGKTFIFDKKTIIKRIRLIETEKKKGLTLEEIVTKLK